MPLLTNPSRLLALRFRLASNITNYRCFASRAGQGSWSALPASEQAAWKALHYTEDSWERRKPPPPWKEWNDLSLEEQSAARYGLGIQDADQWKALAPASKESDSIPSLASLMDGSYDSSDNDNISTRQSTALVAQETRAVRRSQQSNFSSSSLVQMALNTAKGLAPVVGPLLRSGASSGARGSQALGLTVVGSLLEQLPTMMDASGGILDVTGVDTVLYLDDSGSMQGSNLYEAKAALRSLETRLKTTDEDRFLPTRIVKFGNHPIVLQPSEEDWTGALVSLAWDASSGGTYMWKMIEEDILGKYRPAGGKLRVVVVTDGYDVLSPPPYNGVRGFDPLMRTLTREGFDIEWHVLVVGNHGWSNEISDRDQKLYQSLCRATGGQFLSLGASGWDEDDESVADFLEAVEDSGYGDSNAERRARQEQYRLEARRGKAENFDWLPKLPGGGDKK